MCQRFKGIHSCLTWFHSWSFVLALGLLFSMVITSAGPALSAGVEAFDGERLYRAAFTYIRDNHIKLVDPRIRRDWVAEWESKYDGSAQLATEAGADRAVSEMVASVRAMAQPNERFDMYLDGAAADAENKRVEARRAGVGLNLSVKHSMTVEDGRVKRAAVMVVDRVLANGPAHNLVLPGDLVREVGCKSLDLSNDDGCLEVSGTTTAALVDAIGGEPETQVILTLERFAPDGGSSKFRLKLTRKEIVEKVVHFRDLGNRLAYIKIDNFLSGHVEEEMREALTLAAGFEGVIVDVRGNPGGWTELGVRVTGMMLPSGTIFATRTRLGDGFIEDELIARKDSFYSVTRRSGFSMRKPVPRVELLLPEEVPLVVLVDDRTISASEILAGALKTNGRARVIGTRTFGKGVGQAVYDLPFGRKLHITTFEFLPGGIAVNGRGIEPDQTVVPDSNQRTDTALEAAIEHLASL